MLKWRKKNSKGFSLVELIIVIAIMAILVGILAPQFVQYVNKSRKSTDIKNIQEIISAVQVYVADSENKVTSTSAGSLVIPAQNTKYTPSTADTNTNIVDKAMISAGINSFTPKSGEYAQTTISVTIDAKGAVQFAFAAGTGTGAGTGTLQTDLGM